MSTTNNQLSYLLDCINKNIDGTNSSRIFYRTKAFRMFMVSTIISGVITVLLGLNLSEFEEEIRICALALTTVNTIINAYNTFFSNKELWVSNNVANNKLKHLRLDLEYTEKEGTPVAAEQLLAFKKTFQDILDELNSTWQKNRQGEKK
jgi:hypothetical protein